MGGSSVYGCHMVIVDLPVYQRIMKRNLVVAFQLHGEVDGLFLWVHVQRKVIDSGSCGDYEGVVDVSLPNLRDVFRMKGSQGLLFKILHR